MHPLPIAILARVIFIPFVERDPLDEMPVADMDVTAAFHDRERSCRGKADFLSGFAQRQDVNGDGVNDVVIDYFRFTCNKAPPNCGDAGCRVVVFASLPRYRRAKVLDEKVLNITFEKVNGRPSMLLELHGSTCNKAGTATCKVLKFWNGKIFARAR